MKKLIGCLEKPNLQCYIPQWLTWKKKPPLRTNYSKAGLKPLWAFPTIAACSSMLCSVFCQISQVEFWSVEPGSLQQLLWSQAISGEMREMWSSGSAFTVITNKCKAPSHAGTLLMRSERSSGCQARFRIPSYQSEALIEDRSIFWVLQSAHQGVS